MSEEKRTIFREKALERLSSPERLDTLMKVVAPRDWLPLGGLALFAMLAVFWSIFGKIPITVAGKGIVINPRRVSQFQSAISGQLQSLKVKNGQCVRKDDILGIIDPAPIRQQLQQQRDKLAQLRQQFAKTSLVRQQRTELETEAITAERKSLKQRLENLLLLSPQINKEGLNSISQQRQSLEERLRDAKELTPILQQRLTKQRRLQRQGAISQERVLQVEQDYRKTRQNISQIQAQLQQLQLQKTQLQQKYQENLNNITQIKAELEKLNIQSKRLEQDNLEANNTEKNQIQEALQNIARLRKEVADNSMIKSHHAGCILEITATVGQYLQPGNRLGTLQISKEVNDSKSVAYFAVADGKKIKPRMRILITPDTVKRSRFGGIVGEVVEVSPFPVTYEGATSVIGNPEVVNTIMGKEGGKIEVVAKLKLDSDTFSGYKWSSSQGPNLEISSGTTATVRVTVEERSPISFVLPILREWSGVENL
ncbi:MAG: NHLP bacteriocin system secretion protein [Cyanobacteria bacterium P01_H01_bin.150]